MIFCQIASDTSMNKFNEAINMGTADRDNNPINYREKFFELMCKGSTLDEAVENLYINYSSYTQLDLIYKIKKAISIAFKVSIGDVKLIGSSHTGFSLCDCKIVDREHPLDFDFAIVNSTLYTKYFEKMVKSCRSKDAHSQYEKNALQGKIHPLYIDECLKEPIDSNLGKIQEILKIDKHISVCFYISENALIQGLVEYFKVVNAEDLRGVYSKSQAVRPMLSAPIGELINFARK